MNNALQQEVSKKERTINSTHRKRTQKNNQLN